MIEPPSEKPFFSFFHNFKLDVQNHFKPLNIFGLVHVPDPS